MKKIFYIIVGLLLAIGLVYVIKGAQFYRFISRGGKVNQITPAPDKSSYNILALGYGGGKHDGAWLTDSMMVIHVDTKTKKAVMISLPRDIWVKIPTKDGAGFHSKINAVYQMELFPKNYPNVKNPKLTDKAIGNLLSDAVTEVTGLKIDNVVAVDFDGFKEAVDILGGITVNVEKTFDDYRYPIDGNEKDLCGKEEDFKKIEPFISPPYDNDARVNLLKDNPSLDEYLRNATEEPQLAFPCRYEHLHFDKGKVFMNGATALKYVRSRYGLNDGSDFGRAARQQRFLLAVKEKVLSVSFIPKILPMMDQLKDNISIDLSPADIQKFLGEAKNAKSYTVVNFVPSNDNYLTDDISDEGQFILIPTPGIDKWDGLHAIINNIIEGITPTPTHSPTISISPSRTK